MPTRIRVQGVYENGHSPGGLIDMQSIWESPHWRGQRQGGFEEIIFALAVKDDENPHDNWYLFRRALEPKMECFSPPDEREDWKSYVDESSIVVQQKPSEAVRWFERNGLDLPPQLKITSIAMEQSTGEEGAATADVTNLIRAHYNNNQSEFDQFAEAIKSNAQFSKKRRNKLFSARSIATAIGVSEGTIRKNKSYQDRAKMIGLIDPDSEGTP